MPRMKKKKPVDLLYSNRALSSKKVRMNREKDPMGYLLTQQLEEMRRKTRENMEVKRSKSSTTDRKT